MEWNGMEWNFVDLHGFHLHCYALRHGGLESRRYTCTLS